MWTALWHVSASRTITPADMATYLGLTPPAPSMPTSASEPVAPYAPEPTSAPEPMAPYAAEPEPSGPPEPIAPYAPERAPAPHREKLFAPSRYGLGDRSVLAGNARLVASNLQTSATGIALGLGASVLISIAAIYVAMLFFLRSPSTSSPSRP